MHLKNLQKVHQINTIFVIWSHFADIDCNLRQEIDSHHDRKFFSQPKLFQYNGHHV